MTTSLNEMLKYTNRSRRWPILIIVVYGTSVTAEAKRRYIGPTNAAVPFTVFRSNIKNNFEFNILMSFYFNYKVDNQWESKSHCRRAVYLEHKGILL